MLVPTVSVFNAYHGLASPPHDWVVTNEVLSRDALNKSVDCSSTHRELSRADGLFRASLEA